VLRLLPVESDCLLTSVATILLLERAVDAEVMVGYHWSYGPALDVHSFRSRFLLPGGIVFPGLSPDEICV
jgi:hypothetical protein